MDLLNISLSTMPAISLVLTGYSSAYLYFLISCFGLFSCGASLLAYFVYKCEKVEVNVQCPNKNLLITANELWKHPEWISVSGGVFDVKLFAPNHPGGNHIQACGGTDCTELFHSMHYRNSAANLSALQRYRVGTIVGDATFSFQYDSPFALELKSKVTAALGPSRDCYAPTFFWLRAVLVIAFTFIVEYIWISTGSVYAAIAVGIIHAAIGLNLQVYSLI